MSTLQVTNITTGSVATDLIVQSGNSSGPKVIVASNGQYVVLRGNSTANSIYITSTQVYVNGVIPTRPFKTVTGTIMFSGNVTPAALTSNASAYNPDPTSIAFVIRVSGNSASNTANTAYGQTYEPTIFGLTAGSNGEIVVLSNIGAQKIQLRNEDTVTETTAANRFNLPNHVWLGGYQSIKMQYDGTLARWRPLSSLLIASSYKSRLDKGFFAGGNNPIALSSVEKIVYPTETRQTTFSNTITAATDSIAAAGNADKGFYNCIGTPRTTANKISYSDESISAVAGANLSQGRYAAGGAGNADKGFFIGGAVLTPTYVGLTTADRTNYSTETTAGVSGANLSQARGYPQSVGNSDKGFFSGGLGAGGTTYLATADRTTFSTETTAAVSGANLSQARFGGGTTGNADKGFISGGAASPVAPTVTFLSSTVKTTYSTETVATVSSANLSQARFGLSAAGNENKGFFAGGNTPTIVATADRTTYASETTAAAAGANLGTARLYSSAV